MIYNQNIINKGIDTSDATATAEDIDSGKTAYVNGVKVTGISNKVDVISGTIMGTGENYITIPQIVGKENVVINIELEHDFSEDDDLFLNAYISNSLAVGCRKWIKAIYTMDSSKISYLKDNGKITCTATSFNSNFTFRYFAW